MSKKTTRQHQNDKGTVQTQVAKYNLWGVIVTAVLSFLGIALTAYFGYLGTRPSTIQLVTSVNATPTNNQTITLPTNQIFTTATINTPTETPVAIGIPTSAGKSNYQNTLLQISGATCLISVLALFTLITLLVKRFRHFSLEVGNSVTHIGVNRKQPKAYLLSKGLQNNKYELKIYGTTSIGTSKTFVDLVIDADVANSPISRLHCTILETSEGFAIRHEGSANGTFLNGIRLSDLETRPLHDGDVIELGRLQDGGKAFTFRFARE